MLYMLVEGEYLASLPWCSIEVVNRTEGNEQVYRIHTQNHTQRLANLVVGEKGGNQKMKSKIKYVVKSG